MKRLIVILLVCTTCRADSLAEFSEWWLCEQDCKYDYTGDNTVNLKDFAIWALMYSSAFGSDSLYNIPAITYDMTDVSARVEGTTLTPTGTGVTIELDSTVKSPFDGGSTIKFLAKSGVNSYAYITPVAPIPVGTHIGLLIRVDNAAANTDGSFQLKFFNGASANYGFNVLLAASNYGIEANKWKICWIKRGQFTGSSTPADWATSEANRTYTWTKIFIQAAAPSADITYHIGGIVTYTPAKAKIILCMDDGYASAYTEAYTKFKAHGWRGVVGVNSALVGTAGFATLAQLKEMHDYGWDIANHTSDHTQGTNLVAPDAYISKVAACKAYQMANGLTKGSDFFIAPGNDLRLNDLKGADYIEPFFLMGRGRSARSVYGDALITSTFTGDVYSSIVPTDLMNIPYYSLGSHTLAEIQTFVATTTLHRGVGIMYAHKVIDATAEQVSIATFDALIADLAAREAAGTLEVITFTDWWNQIHKNPQVRYPTTASSIYDRYDFNTYYE